MFSFFNSSSGKYIPWKIFSDSLPNFRAVVTSFHCFLNPGILKALEDQISHKWWKLWSHRNSYNLLDYLCNKCKKNWCGDFHYCATSCNLNLNSVSVQVCILFTAYWRFAMMRISENGPSWLRLKAFRQSTVPQNNSSSTSSSSSSSPSTNIQGLFWRLFSINKIG